MSRSPTASDWMQNLPFVLLGIHTATRDDSAISPAHMVYGGPLRLPGEFLSLEIRAPVRTSDFVAQLLRLIRGLVPFPADFHGGQSRSVPVPTALSQCPAVFARVDAVKRPLTPPYVGPYEVLERQDQTFVVMRSGKPWTVSVDGLKPFLTPVMSAPPSSSTSSAAMPPAAASPSQCDLPPAASTTSPASPDLSVYLLSPASTPSPSPSPAPADVITRAGQTVRPPDRFRREHNSPPSTSTCSGSKFNARRSFAGSLLFVGSSPSSDLGQTSF